MEAFYMRFDTDSVAFHEHKIFEIDRIIRIALVDLLAGATRGQAVDSSGNAVGEWFLNA